MHELDGVALFVENFFPAYFKTSLTHTPYARVNYNSAIQDAIIYCHNLRTNHGILIQGKQGGGTVQLCIIPVGSGQWWEESENYFL